MNDPIVQFFLILIMLTVAINYCATEMVKVAKHKGWSNWFRSEFNWKMLLALAVLPLFISFI